MYPPLDRILAVEPGVSARALCNVPNTLGVLVTHFPRFPVLPGVLILDSLAALAALAAGAGAWRLAGVERAQFRRFVRPGDQMELAVELTGRDGRHLTARGSAHVDGRIATAVRELRLVEQW